MEAKSIDTTVSIINGIFGAAHFVFQTAADLTAHTEAKLVEKVTKGDIPYAVSMKYRRDTTFNQQQMCLQKYEELKAKMKSNKESKESSKVYHPHIVIA